MKRFVLLIYLSTALLGCKKEDPNPHLKDPIYLDIATREQAMSTEVSAAEKALKDAQTELSQAKPQLGETKRAQKKYFEAESKLSRTKQEHAALIVRKQTRMIEAKESYRKAFRAGKEWPNPKEFEAYLTAERLRNTKQQWDVPNRIEMSQ